MLGSITIYGKTYDVLKGDYLQRNSSSKWFFVAGDKRVLRPDGVCDETKAQVKMPLTEVTAFFTQFETTQKDYEPPFHSHYTRYYV